MLVISSIEIDRGVGFSWGFGSGEVSATVANNIYDLASRYNDTVSQMRIKFTEGKTAFQTNPAFKNLMTSRVGSRRKNIRLTSSYLGELYDSRIGSFNR